MSTTSVDELAREQQYVSMLYGRLDALRRETASRLREVWRAGSGGTHQARSERDASAALYSDRLAQVNAVEGGLCFGRLDFVDGERLYIGRLGMLDEDSDYEPLLVDWRAPASRPFYCATAAHPDGVVRRRHLHTRGRQVTGFDDDVFDLESLTDTERAHLGGEAALLAALAAGRTGRMRDIVATIQAEQDRVIRAGHEGVLVVQGGPGTGKTAVALHRAGYLLYTHRETLARRGVLLVGPNATFLRYIDQVLPSLGETDALLRTVGELYPGLVATGDEPAETAALKGRHEMAEVIAGAVRDRQRVPDHPVELVGRGPMPGAGALGVPLRIDPAMAERARAAARATRRPHNAARQVFERGILDALVAQAADYLRSIVPRYEDIPLTEDEHGFGDLLDAQDLAELRAELRSEPALQDALDELWPRLTPQRLLAELYASPSRLAAAAPSLDAAELALLARPAGSAWTPADVPLLDEAAELLGDDDEDAAAAAAQRARRELEYAEEVMRLLDLPETATPELLHARDVLDAGHLAARWQLRPRGTTAERAARDRTWTFGHVIVDEAQELSPMAWRVLMRRCPTRSMTIVGDIAQTGSLAGATSWSDVLDRYVGDRWRLAELTVNYRTPTEIMAVAAGVLASVDPMLAMPASVRSSGVTPWRRRVPAERLPAEVAAAVRTELAEVTAAGGDGRGVGGPGGVSGIGDPGGNLAVIAPVALARRVAAALPDVAAGGDPAALQHRVLVLTVEQVKGLEFDAVLVVEPALILSEAARGARDLYVALTRATRRLGVLHTGELPAMLGGLLPAPG